MRLSRAADLCATGFTGSQMIIQSQQFASRQASLSILLDLIYRNMFLHGLSKLSTVAYNSSYYIQMSSLRLYSSRVKFPVAGQFEVQSSSFSLPFFNPKAQEQAKA